MSTYGLFLTYKELILLKKAVSQFQLKKGTDYIMHKIITLERWARQDQKIGVHRHANLVSKIQQIKELEPSDKKLIVDLLYDDDFGSLGSFFWDSFLLIPMKIKGKLNPKRVGISKAWNMLPKRLKENCE